MLMFIWIEQYSIVNYWKNKGIKFDLIDWAIIYSINVLGINPETKRIDVNWESFFRANYKQMIERLPLLCVDDENIIKKRFDKLVKAEILKKIIYDWEEYYCGTENYWKMFWN